MSSDDSCGCGDCGCSDGEDDGLDPASFHPAGEDWEEEMRKRLDETEYDTDLGLNMAEDAMRLTAGEISEEEFYNKYNDAVVDEFEQDDRPMAEQFEVDEVEDGGVVQSLTELAGGDVPRREAMKKMGAGAAALGLGGMASRQESESAVQDGSTSPWEEHDEEGPRYGMVIDLERCDGCLQCVVGCMEENDTSTGANWMYVLAYEDENTEQENFLVRPCQHCSNAPCAKVCPVGARHIRDKDGLVLTDYEICIGCRYCQVACPYGVNYFQWGEPDVPFEELSTGDYGPEELRAMDDEERFETLQENEDHVYDERGRWVDSRPTIGTMGKCTFCPTRQDGIQGEEMVGTTACMDACDAAGMSAIHFGDMNDPESRPNRYLRRRAEQESEQDTQFEEPQEDYEETVTPWGKLSSFKLQENLGTEPNITYLGNEPSEEAEQVDGPVDYESLSVDNGVEVVDRRKEHTDLGAQANQLGVDQ